MRSGTLTARAVRLTALAALLLFGSAGPAPAEGPGALLLALVNGDSVTTEDLDAELARTAAGEREGAPGSGDPEAILKRLIQNRLFEQEGYGIGFDSLPEVRNQVRTLVRRKATVALLDSISALLPPPDSSRVDSLLGVKNVMNRVSHILVADSASAEAVLESLDAGASFGDLAGRVSLDTASAVRGGDLGWAREGMFVPEFEEAIRGLEPGRTGGPVRTSHGWHVVRLQETREESYGRSEKMRAAIVDAIRRESVTAALAAYVDSLKVKYGVTVDDSLLRSLDYASSDPAVQEGLRTAEQALVESRAGRLSVRGLTRAIHYQYFHGLAGRKDAAAIRDRMFEDWLAEALLGREAAALGLERRPEIRREGRRLERQLVREEILQVVLESPTEPGPEEVERYYREHTEKFLPPRRLKIHSVVLGSEEEAAAFRARMEEGAGLRWLASRTEGVLETDPPSMSGWLSAAEIGVGEDDLRVGKVLGPVEGPGGWLVAEVSAVEEAGALPLAECRDRVLLELRAEKARETVAAAIAKLEEAASIEVRPDARSTIEARLMDWKAERAVGSGAAGPRPVSRGEIE